MQLCNCAVVMVIVNFLWLWGMTTYVGGEFSDLAEISVALDDDCITLKGRDDDGDGRDRG